MNECKLSENNWTRVAVFAGGDRGHYRTDFDCFVGVDRGSLWVLEEDLPLALAVGDFDSVTADEFKNVPNILFKPSQKKMIQIWNWLS